MHIKHTFSTYYIFHNRIIATRSKIAWAFLVTSCPCSVTFTIFLVVVLQHCYGFRLETCTKGPSFFFKYVFTLLKRPKSKNFFPRFFLDFLIQMKSYIFIYTFILKKFNCFLSPYLLLLHFQEIFTQHIGCSKTFIILP